MKKRFGLRAVAAMCAATLLLPLITSCGEEGEAPDASSESSEPAVIRTVTVGEAEYGVTTEVNIESEEDGVYIFTRENGKTVAPARENGEFADYAVSAGAIVAVCGRGTPAIIPQNGFVLRFAGKDTPAFELGTAVTCDGAKYASLPKKYVRFGETVIEVGHENEIRVDEDTGWFYDSRWYSATTTNNIWCTEIAVADGKIVEINRSGDDIGDTRIPENGYVIAVGQGGANERKTAKFKVGDDAELFLGEPLYCAQTFGFSGSDRSRPEDGMVIFTDKEKTTTPIGSNLTEISVSKSGTVTAVRVGSNGMNKIPEKGFILSSTGKAATKLARSVAIGDKIVKSGNRTVIVITNPESVLARLNKKADALKTKYESSLQSLSYVDYGAIEAKLAKIEECVADAKGNMPTAKNVDSEAFERSILALQTLIPEAEVLLTPNISVQDRTAWVTLGEYDYSKNITLHYKTPEDVDHTVAYAKEVGLNTLIIDNLAACFAVYDSEVEGMVKLPRLGEVDLLAEFKRACDEQGIRLIIMVHAFSSGVNNVAYPKNHYMSIYKDKYLKTNKGNHVGPDEVITLDPADEAVQAFNLAVLTEICEKYDVYGVQADYMRYPLPYYYQLHNYEDFGYNESSTAGFIKKYGKDPAKMLINDPLWEKWCEWRRDIISDYQKRFYQTAKSVNPDLNVSFTCFAEYTDRQKYTYQDVEKWAENGYADAIYPMIYGDTTEYQLGYAEKNLPLADSADLILGVGAYVKATHESMEEQVIMPYDLCTEGFSVFTLRYISICGYDALYRRLFAKPATPATAPEAELIPACREMITSRLECLAFAAEKLDEGCDAKVLGSLADSVGSLNSLSFADFAAELSALREALANGEDTLPQTVKDAALHVLDYVIKLQ